MSVGATVTVSRRDREATAFRVLAGISVAHLLNDTIQSIVPAIYPVLKESFALSFAQIGLLTPVVGLAWLAVSYGFWRFGLQHYQGTGS